MTTPRLSQSIAWTLLTRSPLHAWHEHRELGGKSRKATLAMDKGTLVHEMVLGGSKVSVVDLPDWRTKAARDARDVLRNEGRTPILRHQFEAAMPAAEKIIRTIEDFGLALETSHREKRLQWTQDGVECEGTPDAFDLEVCIVDLKTCERIPTPTELGRKACMSGWALQRAAYLSALDHLHPEFAGRIPWYWVVAEIDEPYAVTIAEADSLAEELGRRQWQRALNQWKELLAIGWDEPWPYPQRMVIEAPAWVLANEEMQEVA